MASNQRPPMGPPETPGRYLQHPSPGLFPTLQLSPDIYATQFSAGPATAPAYSNQRFFWDPSNVDFQDPSFCQPYQDHFQFSPVTATPPFTSSSTVLPSLAATNPPLEERPYELPALPRSASYSHNDTSAFPAPFTTSPRVPAPQMENPSMFLSSPARRFGTGDQYSSRFPQHLGPERPAYAHQIEESKREEESKRLRRGDSRKPSITRSVMEALRRPVSPKKDGRPGLKRSLTHTGVRNERGFKPQSLGSVGGRNSPIPHDHNMHRPGRSSPLKSTVDPVARTLSTSRNAKRGAMSLAIDENGVAKTVISKVSDDMDLDETSESEPDSFDEEDFHFLHSQGNSFACGGDDEPTQAQASRLHGHCKTDSHSTTTSANSARQSSYQGSSSSLTNNRSSDGQQGRRKRPILGSNVHDDTLMEEEPSGNAQQVLRAIIQDRSRSTSSQGDNNQLHSSPPLHQGQYASYNASPTTITDPDLATPSTDMDSLASNLSLRCLCKSSIPDGSVPMVQW